MEENRIKVIYHKDCLDGFSSAWIAWTVFGDQADYIPATHHPDPEVFEGCDVYFVDIVYKQNVMDKFIKKNEKVVAIDHHDSSKETVKSIDDHLFSNDHSAAVLTWKYFYPNKDIPKFIRYMEDIDLWKFDMEHTQEVVAYLALRDKEFETWSQLVEDFEDDEKIKNHLKKGRVALKHKDYLINRVVSKAAEIEFEGHKILSVNSPVLISDVGAKLYEKHPPFSVIWYRGHGKLKVSMRSDGTFDVSEIAKKYGGGGHPVAASFKLDVNEELPWRYLDKNELQN